MLLSAKIKDHGTGLRERILLWPLFFLICFGLGYPTLRRYDPRRTAGLTPDSEAYYALVSGAPEVAPGDLTHRVLVPYVARPFYWLARERIGAWDPGFFALLVSNSLFLAITACLLVSIAFQAVGSYSTALLSGTIYLLNFAVPNLDLAGYIDSGEACLLTALVWALHIRRWPLLPVLGFLGALAKETFIPLSVALAVGWWIAEGRRIGLRNSLPAWIGAMAMSGFIAFTATTSLVSRYTPWSFALAMHAASGSHYFYFAGLLRCILDRTFWYVFIWLLPLGLWRLNRLPQPWVVGSSLASVTALLMGAYNDAGGNTARAVFSVAGPLLSLSVAVLLTESPRESTGFTSLKSFV